MKFTIWEPEEAQKKFNELWDTSLVELPSQENPDFIEFKEDYRARQEYIKHIGFTLFNAEFADELDIELKLRGITTFVETGSGYGAFTRLLNNIGFKGKGYTLRLPENPNENHWGLKINSIYTETVKSGETILKDLNEVRDEKPDLILSSWVPLEGGEEVQAFFENNSYPMWYLVIGEGLGGCTGNDDYHVWLDKHYNKDHRFDTFVSFDMLYDNAILYKLKDEKERYDGI